MGSTIGKDGVVIIFLGVAFHVIERVCLGHWVCLRWSFLFNAGNIRK